MSRAAINLVGNRYGRLTVVARAENRVLPSGQRPPAWHCICDCGTEKTVRGSHLRTGNVQSCGCLQKERTAHSHTTHGYTTGKHKYLYETWTNIKARCYKPENKRYKRYGGRGICLATDWLDDIDKFANWILENLGERPEGMTLDRVNNNGNYEPGNLKWSTPKEQRENQERQLTHSGQVLMSD